jgi:hypothetical protein
MNISSIPVPKTNASTHGAAITQRTREGMIDTQETTVSQL